MILVIISEICFFCDDCGNDLGNNIGDISGNNVVNDFW